MDPFFKNVLVSTSEAAAASSHTPDAGIAEGSFGEYLAAFTAAIFVLTSGMFASQTLFLNRASGEAASAVETIAYGFSHAFAAAPDTVAANISAASTRIGAIRASYYPGAVPAPAYWSRLQTAPEAIGISASAVPDVAILHTSGTAAAAEAAGARSFASARRFVSQAFVLAENPSAGLSFLASGYQAVGESGYGAARGVLAGYVGLIERAGASALTLASAALAGAQTLPSAGYGAALFVGNTTIQTTHALLRTETMLAYEPALLAPRYARMSFVAVNSLGETLLAAAVSAPAGAERAFSEAVRAPSLIAPAISEKVFSEEYRSALGFVSLSRLVAARYLAMVKGAGVIAYTGTAAALAVPLDIERGYRNVAVAFARGYGLEKKTLGSSFAAAAARARAAGGK